MKLKSIKYFRIKLNNAWYAKIGRMHCFLFDKNGIPAIAIGPHWPFYIGLITVILAVGSIFTFYLAPDISPYMVYLGFCITSFLVVGYTGTFLRNPGILIPEPDDELELESQTIEKKVCLECKATKTATSEHCYSCEVCIDGHDHHCPWTSKCVGKGNMIWFYAFLSGLVALIVYVSLTLAFRQRTLIRRRQKKN